MSYLENTLLRGEVIRFRGHVHWIIFLPCALLAGAAMAVEFYVDQWIVSGMLLFIAGLSFIKAFIYFFTTELGVTDERVIAKFGFIRRTTFELSLDRVTSLNVRQTVLGRILNYGDIFINGMGGPATPIPVIADPLTFRRWALMEVRGG